VFWRGSTSGRMPQDRDWRKLPRIMMCKLASTRPDVFDVGISYSANLPDDAGAEIRAGGLERARIPDWAFNYYRYHIDIDGNTNAWASLFIKLLSGSPVLKVTSPHGFRQWYYDRLKPWVHYVPVEADMSDLIEKAEWIRNHDADAVRMGRAAQSLAADMTLDAEVNLAGERVAAALDHRKVKRMRTIPATQIMMKIHGADIYEGFTPELAEDLQGWNSTSPIFAEIIKVTRPNIIVDVGVWKGASTLFFANLLRANGIDGAVIAVGTFLGGIEHWLLDSPHYDKMPRRHGKPILYEQFLSNVVRHDLAGYVVPLPQSSLIAAMLLRHHRITVDLVHIDADHSYEAVMSDARTYWTLLNPGGYLIGDDYDKGWPGVVQAADEFAAEMGIELTISSPKWIARKPLPV
jgi:hypothetical protein